jgi:hypothetical protein
VGSSFRKPYCARLRLIYVLHRNFSDPTRGTQICTTCAQATRYSQKPHTAAMSRHLNLNYTSTTTRCLSAYCLRFDRAAQPVPLYIKDPKGRLGYQVSPLFDKLQPSQILHARKHWTICRYPWRGGVKVADLPRGRFALMVPFVRRIAERAWRCRQPSPPRKAPSSRSLGWILEIHACCLVRMRKTAEM